MIKQIKVQVYTLKEAEEIMHLMIRNHYEGVQNDSYRYCKLGANRALKSGRCYICCSCVKYSNMRISNIHDKKRKNYLEVSKSRFIKLMSNYGEE